MVRLKDGGLQMLFCEIEKFQFHNGSIKSVVSRRGVVSRRFQFHNGSIKSCTSIKLRSVWNWFQFHNGSIKRLYVLSRLSRAGQFQFHNGSIKSISSALNSSSHLRSFNSTMVRLKVSHRFRFGYEPCVRVSCFNSTMVRLKVVSHAKLIEWSLNVSIPQWFD